MKEIIKPWKKHKKQKIKYHNLVTLCIFSKLFYLHNYCFAFYFLCILNIGHKKKLIRNELPKKSRASIFLPKTSFELLFSSHNFIYHVLIEPIMSSLSHNRHHIAYFLCLFGLITIMQSCP
jgi:hypothetical protein